MEFGEIRSTVVRLALIICGLPACAGLAPAGPALDQLPMRWHDERDHAVTLAEFGGHRVLLTMAYANCHRICPVIIDELKRFQDVLDARGEVMDFVIVGYDPEHEDQTTWRQYRTRNHLPRANWHFISGTRDDTERLARQLGFDYWMYDAHVMHGSRVVLFDARGALVAVADPAKRDWAAML